MALGMISMKWHMLNLNFKQTHLILIEEDSWPFMNETDTHTVLENDKQSPTTIERTPFMKLNLVSWRAIVISILNTPPTI